MLTSYWTRKNIFRWSAAVTVMVGAAFLGFNCAPLAVNEQGAFGTSTNSSSGQAEPEMPVALLSSEQILKAMVSATGVEGFSDPTAIDDLIQRTYAERSGSLPSDHSLKQVTGPMLIAVTNLASAVCAKAVSREAGIGEAQRDTRLFFRELDFSRGVGGQSSDSVSLAFERLARNAWRRDITAEEETWMVQFAQEFSSGVSATDPAQTRLLAVSICTAVLSSVDSLTY